MNRIRYDVESLNENIFNNLQNIYDIFYDVERRNLLALMTLKLMNGELDEGVGFTKLSLIIQEKYQ